MIKTLATALLALAIAGPALARDLTYDAPASMHDIREEICTQIDLPFTEVRGAPLYVYDSAAANVADAYASWIYSGCNPDYIPVFEHCLRRVVGVGAAMVKPEHRREINFCSREAARTVSSTVQR